MSWPCPSLDLPYYLRLTHPVPALMSPKRVPFQGICAHCFLYQGCLLRRQPLSLDLCFTRHLCESSLRRDLPRQPVLQYRPPPTSPEHLCLPGMTSFSYWYVFAFCLLPLRCKLYGSSYLVCFVHSHISRTFRTVPKIRARLSKWLSKGLDTLKSM